MSKLILQVRTKDNLLELLAAGESPAWLVSEDHESRLTHVQIVNWDGTQMIEGVFDKTGSYRRKNDRDQNRLVIRFLDGHIVNTNPRVEFDGQNPVRFVEG